MKLRTTFVVVVMAGLLFGSIGCSKVMVSPEYKTLISDTNNTMQEIANRADKGLLSEPEMVLALRLSADSWQRIDDAVNGVSEE